LHKPLRRLGLLSATAIGAMVPDLDLVSPIRLVREQTHGRLALLTFCLPVGLAAWAVFQMLIKPALIEVLPDGMYTRLTAEHPVTRLGSVSAWLYAALAVLFGALTHIIWDGFTHEDGGGARMPYHWLQHGSSVLGMAAVFVAMCLWVRHARQPSPLLQRRLAAPERSRWVAVYLAIPVLLIGAVVAQTNHYGWARLYSTAAMTQLAATATHGALLALVFTSALIRRRLLMLDAHRPSRDV
jgi:Domain of unknown function (DUF4184)